MGTVTFILPVPHFFSKQQGCGGHVAHFIGVAEAFNALGMKLDILADTEMMPALSRQNSIHPISPAATSLLKRFRWNSALLNEVRKLQSEHQSELCYCRYSSGFSPWLFGLRRSFPHTPIILEVNSVGAMRHPWFRFIEKKTLPVADLITCVSAELKDVVSSTYPDLRSKLLLIANGVDVSRFRIRNEEDRAHRETRFGYAGTLKLNYGLETLLTAFSTLQEGGRVPGASLHIYGEGPARPKLEGFAKNIKGVHFHGAKPFFDMPTLLQTLDVLVYTTAAANKYHSPIKLYEYMASRKAVIASRTNQTEELLGREQRGLLYNIDDSRELAQKMEKLALDTELAKQLSYNARLEVETHHSWQSRVTAILSAVQELPEYKGQRRLASSNLAEVAEHNHGSSR